MSLLMKSFLSVFLLALNWGYAVITPILDWDPVIQAVNGVPPKTSCVVVLDVDDVLMIPKDLVFHSKYQGTREAYLQSKSAVERSAISGIIFSEWKVDLVDPAVLDVLKLVQDKKLQAFALTLMGTGCRGKVAHLEDLRIAQLKGLSMDFDLLSGYQGEWELKKRGGKRGEPLLKKGVIYAAGFDKGKIFFEALDLIEYRPECVIFIDDRRDHLESMERVCRERGIEFIGFEYGAVAHRDCLPLNKEVFNYQIEVLERDKTWMSDDEVKEKLAHKKTCEGDNLSSSNG